MKLLWLRHAESVGNQQGVQGGDFELSEHGQWQAQQLSAYLSRGFWLPSHVYSSPRQRAVQTTQILLQSLRVNPVVCDVEVLQEIHNGIFEGLTWQQSQQQHPELCQSLMSSAEWLPIPGGESLQHIRDRAQQFITQLFATHQNSDRLWIITHGGVLLHLIATLLGSERTWGMDIPPTALFEFECDLDRWNCTDQNCYNSTLWKILRFNQMPHLRT
jgi:broad specificity phosphatase PhoE